MAYKPLPISTSWIDFACIGLPSDYAQLLLFDVGVLSKQFIRNLDEVLVRKIAYKPLLRSANWIDLSLY